MKRRRKAGIHPAIMTYLEIKKANFYRVETTVDGKTFITARGWEDLSRIISLYEECGIKVDIQLIRQYLHNPKIASDFAGYYDLFNKYRSDYQVDSILAGKASEEIKERAKNADLTNGFHLSVCFLTGYLPQRGQYQGMTKL